MSKAHTLQGDGAGHVFNGYGGLVRKSWMQPNQWGAGVCTCGATGRFVNDDADRIDWWRTHLVEVGERRHTGHMPGDPVAPARSIPREIDPVWL